MIFVTGKLQPIDPKVFSQEQLWIAGKRKRAAPKSSGKRAKVATGSEQKEEAVPAAETEAKADEAKPAPMES